MRLVRDLEAVSVGVDSAALLLHCLTKAFTSINNLIENLLVGVAVVVCVG